MAVADVVILNIARILDRTGNLKDTNKSIGFIMAFVHYQLSLNRLRCAENQQKDGSSASSCTGGGTSDGTLMRLRIRPHKGRGWNVPPLFLQHFGIFAPPR